MNSLMDLALELAEDLAIEKFYIKRGFHVAEKPAFLLFRDFLGARWSLVLDGLHISRLRSKAEAYKIVKEFAANSKVPIQIVTKRRSKIGRVVTHGIKEN